MEKNSKEKFTPLQLDFIVWSKMQKDYGCRVIYKDF